MDKKYSIFISSTYKDLKDQRNLIKSAIETSGHTPIAMELFPACNEEQFEYIKKRIDECDIYIILVGDRYGSICPKNNLSFTELEYDYAKNNEKYIICLLFETTSNNNIFKKLINLILNIFPSKLKSSKAIEMSNDLEKLKIFKEKLTKYRLCKFVKNDAEIANETHNAIREIEKNFTSLKKLDNPNEWIVDHDDIYYEPDSDFAITIDEEIKKDIREIKYFNMFQYDTCLKENVWDKWNKTRGVGLDSFDLIYTYKYGNILKGIRRIKRIKFIEFYIRQYPNYGEEGMYYFPSEIWECINKKSVNSQTAYSELKRLIKETDEYKICIILAQNKLHKTFNTFPNDFIFDLLDFDFIIKMIKLFGKE